MKWLLLWLLTIFQGPMIPYQSGFLRNSQPAPAPLCAEMQHGAYYPSGYGFFDAVVGRSTNSIRYVYFQPAKSGTITTFKWYNSSGSHAIWNNCTLYYGSINPCANDGGQPKYMNTKDPNYPLVFPNGWWPYANTCSSNYSGCYAGGTGGKVFLTLMNSSGITLATATINQPNVTYGFYSTFPVVTLSNSVSLTANSYYYIKVEDDDSNPTANWFSIDCYTPYNLFTASQANAKNLVTTTLGGKSGVANAIVEDTYGGSADTNFQPIFALGYSDGTCITQGFAP